MVPICLVPFHFMPDLAVRFLFFSFLFCVRDPVRPPSIRAGDDVVRRWSGSSRLEHSRSVTTDTHPRKTEASEGTRKEGNEESRPATFAPAEPVLLGRVPR